MDNIEIFEYRKNELVKLIKDSLNSAAKAHDILFDSVEEKETIAALYLNKAISLMAAARSIYVSDYEILQRTEIENIFTSFSVFESEFLNNIATNHSHQWTNIEFSKFKDDVEAFIN